MNHQTNFNSFLKSHTDNINFSIDIINKIEASRENLNHEDLCYLDRILEINNILITANVVALDCIIILKNFTSAPEETPYWERLFYVKSSCLLIHEFLSSFGNNGKVIKEMLADNNQLMSEYNSISKKRKEFQSKYEKKISLVRNLISAHIGKDWRNNFKIISEINNPKDGNMVLEFFSLLNTLIVFLVKLLAINSSDFDLNALFEKYLSTTKEKQ